MQIDSGNAAQPRGTPALFCRHLKPNSPGSLFGCTVLILLGCLTAEMNGGQSGPVTDSPSPSVHSQDKVPPAPAGTVLVQPEELARQLKSGTTPKPLVIQVGFQVLYTQAHIPGSEFIGPATNADAIRKLRSRVESLPREQNIVIYCGCCPWDVCPNVTPAVGELRAMGFRNLRVLYIADNFGRDWVGKGFPVEKGE